MANWPFSQEKTMNFNQKTRNLNFRPFPHPSPHFNPLFTPFHPFPLISPHLHPIVPSFHLISVCNLMHQILLNIQLPIHTAPCNNHKRRDLKIIIKIYIQPRFVSIHQLPNRFVHVLILQILHQAALLFVEFHWGLPGVLFFGHFHYLAGGWNEKWLVENWDCC